MARASWRAHSKSFFASQQIGKVSTTLWLAIDKGVIDGEEPESVESHRLRKRLDIEFASFVGPACLTAGTLAQAIGRRPGNRWQHRNRHLPHSQTFALNYFRRALCVELGCLGCGRAPVCRLNGLFLGVGFWRLHGFKGLY